MKKKVLSILLTAAMVMSMAVGCGSNKSASTDAKDDTKTESSADGESNQILLNGSSTLLLSQRISSIHMEHGKLMIPLFQMKILQFMFPQVVPDKEQKLSSMVHLLSVW